MNDRTQEKIRNGIEACLSGAEMTPTLEERVLARIRGQRRPPLKVTAAMAAVLVLMLLTVTALAAGAVFGLFRVEQGQVGAMRSLASDGNTLYLMTTEGLHTWHPSQKEPTRLLSEKQLQKQGLSADGILFFRDDTLCFLHPKTKSVHTYNGRQFAEVGNYSATPLDQPQLQVTGAAFQQETLLLRAVVQGAVETEAKLFLWHLPDNTLRQVEAANVVEICPYADGDFLLLQDDLTEGKTTLSVMDAASGQIADTLCTMPLQSLRGIMVHPETQKLYAIVKGAPAVWQNGGWQSMQAYALHNTTTEYAVVQEGFAAIHFDNLQYIPFAPADTLGTLHIRGVMATNDEDAAFQTLYPAWAVQRQTDPALNPGDVRQAIESGDTTDLFHLVLDADVVSMFMDGTLQPLSGSDALLADAAGMLPAIQNGLQYGGVLYAVPSFALINVWEGEGAPGCFADMLSQGGAQNAAFVKHSWADTPWSLQDYADYLLTAFLLESGNEKPDFTAPSFVSALYSLQTADLPQGNHQAGKRLLTTNVVVNLNGQRVQPADSDGNVVYAASDEASLQAVLPGWIVPCPVREGAPSAAATQLFVYVLNPNAANPEAALHFLEFVAFNRDPSDQALLSPANAQPVLHPGVEADLEWMVEEQRLFEAEHGLEPDEEGLNARMDAVRSAPDSWAVEEKRLQKYQTEIAPYLNLRLHPLLTRKARAEGGVYDRMLQTILSCLRYECTPEECAEKMNQLLP